MSLPVPEVYSWSSNSLNPAGAEYIVMEKAGGVQLFKQWGEMTQLSKLGLIKALTKFENQLSSVQFPAYGSLYLRDSCPDLVRYQPLDISGDSTGSYCVGPSCERAYMLGSDISLMENVDMGPCKYVDFYTCVVFLKSAFREFHINLWKSYCKHTNQ